MIVHGWLPVNTTLRFVLAPLQIVAVPLKVLVGFGFTVTIGVPVKLVPVQFASATAVTEYVFVLVGLTDIA